MLEMVKLRSTMFEDPNMHFSYRGRTDELNLTGDDDDAWHGNPIPPARFSSLLSERRERSAYACLSCIEDKSLL